MGDFLRRRKRRGAKGNASVFTNKEQMEAEGEAGVAARKIQGKLRVNQAGRKSMKIKRTKAKASGVMRSLPGTIQGQTGWYIDDSNGMCTRWNVTNGQWQMMGAPVTEQAYQNRMKVVCQAGSDGSSKQKLKTNQSVRDHLRRQRNSIDRTFLM